MRTKKSKVKLIPLGGLGEIGKNITAIEYENEIIVIDCGLSFPDNEMYGIDLVIPDISYLLENFSILCDDKKINRCSSIHIKGNKCSSLCN